MKHAALAGTQLTVGPLVQTLCCWWSYRWSLNVMIQSRQLRGSWPESESCRGGEGQTEASETTPLPQPDSVFKHGPVPVGWQKLVSLLHI